MGELIGVIVVMLLVFGMVYIDSRSSEQVFMKDAYDRGFAVQCVGKAGYYWECKDEQ